MSTPPQPPPTPPEPEPETAPAPKRLLRSSADRIIGGVCGGIGRYFGVDPTLVRIGAVALVLLGGAGLVVYAAALLLVPLDDESPAAPSSGRDRVIAVAFAIGLLIAGLTLGGLGLAFGGALVPLAFLALAGLAVWWFVSGERPAGSPREVVRRAAAGVGLLLACFALGVGSFFASGLGGGVMIAALVIVAGAALVAAAFVGGARWLVLPALAIALPLAFVSAAGIDLDGGIGDKRVHPASVAELRDGYRLGAGQLIVDLRDIELPPGDRRLSIEIGAGHALVLVREDVCVAGSARIGMGAVAIFNRENGGIDVDWSDGARAAKKTPRLIVDGDVGLGLLEVSRHDDGRHEFGPRDDKPSERNDACLSRTASATRGAGASHG